MISVTLAELGAKRIMNLETTIQDLLTGQYRNPICVIPFNTAERWSEDVSEDVAHELRRRCDPKASDSR